jgi:AIG2 family protein
MQSIRYFAYGSNMLTEWLRSRCPSARPCGVASAAGYALAFSKKSVDGSGKAMLTASSDPAARVYGVLFEIDAREIEALDCSEGRGKGYDRIDDFTVRDKPGGEPVPVTSYTADGSAVDGSLKPYDWYLDLTMKGAERHGLPDATIKALADQPFVPDLKRDSDTALNAFRILSGLSRKGRPLRSRANIRIAGNRTVGHWILARAKLASANDPQAWIEAFEDFFLERLQSRYFGPIETLGRPETQRKNGQEPWRGEGFAIVALQCSLIEFLGATLKGQSYVHPSQLNGRPPDVHQYTASGKMFVEFLTMYPPFKEVFTTTDLAWDFYNGVRCGLLHEARTKNGWTIRSRKAVGACIDAAAKIIYRDDFQNAFQTFAAWYATQLPKNKDYQAAFLRKFDSLCTD